MNTLYVAWQDSLTREWIPVAKLERLDEGYRLSYTAGARRARGFNGLGRMNDLTAKYDSSSLFAAFANRIISKSRPEYSDYLKWTGLTGSAVDPLQILGITGGIRGTDSLELFPLPVAADGGGWSVDFFLRGVRHLPDHAGSAISALKSGDKLFLMLDVQNEFDQGAISVRTKSPASLIGYCPRYYCPYIHAVYKDGGDLSLTVKRVNLDAPTSMRLLCTLHTSTSGVATLDSHNCPDDLRPYLSN